MLHRTTRYEIYRSHYHRRRRIPVRALLHALLIAVLLAFFAFCIAVVYRAFRAQPVMEQIRQQNQALQQTLNRYQAVMPDPALVEQVNGQPLDYQTMYPEMQVNPPPTPKPAPANTVYLTFDDGPSANTVRILDALKKTGQKATFFVVGSNIPGNEAILQRIVKEGHTIGLHSYSHNYAAIYASVKAFLEDFHKAYQMVYNVCGVYPTIFRFPGGSVSAYSAQTYQPIIAEMLRRGFLYYDWSVSAGDETTAPRTITQITQTVLQGVKQTKDIPIVLLHNGADKGDTAYAFANLLSELSKAGYTCDRLTNAIQPVTFAYTS